MEISEALKGVELNEEQEKSMTEFLSVFAEDIKAKTLAQAQVINEDEIVKREKTKYDEELAKVVEENKQAFALFEEKAREAFTLFHDDSKKAFEAGREDLRAEYTETMAQALEDLFEEVEARAKQDIFESDEFKAFETIKKVIAPMIVEGDKQSVFEEVQALKAEKEQLLADKANGERTKVIATLLEDFPAEHTSAVEKFISCGKTIDEVYDRFNVIVEMLQTDITSEEPTAKPRFKKKAVQTPVAPVASQTPVVESTEIGDTTPATSLFESTSTVSASQEVTKADKSKALFSPEERQMLSSIFGYIK